MALPEPRYDRDGVTLYEGDCRDILPSLGGVDALVTDPPFGLDLGVVNGQRRDKSHLGKRAYRSYDDTYENFVHEIVPRLNASLAIAKRGAVFTGPHIQEQAKATAIGGIWHPGAMGRTPWGSKNFLPFLLYGNPPDGGRHRPTVLRSTAVADKSKHPCPKPLEWMIWLIELTTRPGDLVLDPFAGTAITGVACAKTGRCFIGIEIDPEYATEAERRLREAETPLFAGMTG